MNLFRQLMLVALIAVGMASAAAFGQVVQIPERVEVTADSLVLGDIARISPGTMRLEEIPLGYAPYAGAYRWLERADVENYLRRWGADPAEIDLQMAERVLVTRESQVVSESAIREAVETLLAEVEEADLVIKSMEFPQQVILPAGDLRIETERPARFAQLNPLSLKIDFYVNGQRQQTQWVRARLQATARVVVAARDVPYGHTLQPSDLSLETRELTRLEDFYDSVEEVSGTVARRTVRGGSVLSSRDIKAATLVKRGDLVTLVAQGSNFRIRTMGRARDNGSLGEDVTIENLDSKELVRARVVAKNQVQVFVTEIKR